MHLSFCRDVENLVLGVVCRNLVFGGAVWVLTVGRHVALEESKIHSKLLPKR